MLCVSYTNQFMACSGKMNYILEFNQANFTMTILSDRILIFFFSFILTNMICFNVPRRIGRGRYFHREKHLSCHTFLETISMGLKNFVMMKSLKLFKTS